MTALLVPHRPSTLAPWEMNPALDGTCLRIPPTAWTYAGFREWATSDEFPEKLRVTFVAGEIYLDMSKEEIQTHAAVKSEVCRVTTNLNRKAKKGKIYLDGVLVSNEDAKVSNNPDAVFVSHRSLRTGRVRLVPRGNRLGQFLELEGTPDWVLEILSDSSVGKDTDLLMTAYYQAGIREYWLIDARGEEIDFRILVWRKSGYVPAPCRGAWQESPVFNREFRLDRQQDEHGLWEYTLHVRSIRS